MRVVNAFSRLSRLPVTSLGYISQVCGEGMVCKSWGLCVLSEMFYDVILLLTLPFTEDTIALPRLRRRAEIHARIAD